MFDRIKELCGGSKAGNDSSSRPRPHPDAVVADGEIGPESEEVDRDFFGVHFEGLGDIWAAVFGDVEEREIVGCMRWVAKEGVLCRNCDVVYEAEGRRVALLQAPAEGGIRVAALVEGEDGQAGMRLVSSFPLLEGRPNDLLITGTRVWSNGVEGVAAARLAPDGPPVTFFAPFLFRDFQRIVPGATLSVSLGALALSLEKAGNSFVDVADGPLREKHLAEFLAAHPDRKADDCPPTKVFLNGARILLPSRYVCEWECRCPVLDVEETSLRGIPFVKIATEFACGENASLRGNLYASERILRGYVPKKGDDVEGGLWMSGRLTDEDAVTGACPRR